MHVQQTGDKKARPGLATKWPAAKINFVCGICLFSFTHMEPSIAAIFNGRHACTSNLNSAVVQFVHFATWNIGCCRHA